MLARHALPENPARVVWSSNAFLFTTFHALCAQWSTLNSFAINRLRTLFDLMGGRGCLFSIRWQTSPTCQRPLTWLCFQQLLTVKFSNSFVLITIQIAGGVG